MSKEVYENGGQGGTPPHLLNQTVSSPNRQKPALDNIGASGALPTKIEAAGRWLYLNRELVSGPLLPFLCCRFGLKTQEAVEASKLAHALEYPGAVQ